MPYIEEKDKERLGYVGATGEIENVGQLNYCITKMVDEYIGPDFNYEKINGAIGALYCAKVELYRRVAVPYENKKIAENGDVYLNREERKNPREME